MKKILSLITTIGACIIMNAQASKDKEVIDKLCGCFEVNFKYAETFSPDPAYKYHDREETGGTAELALPIEVTDRKIVIQHLLVVSPTVVVKHWREEWTYENPVIWKYTGDRKWVKEVIPAEQVKGKWTQTVWEVSDEPRYQGYSQFVSLDGKIIWQSTADAPLPRREYSVRNDYNILKRTNRLNLTDSGYIHEQDNQKIIRRNGVDQLLVEEKGINSYKRLNDKECAAANEYWEKTRDYWAAVRKAWAGYLNTHNSIQLHNKVEGRMLHEYLMELAKDFTAGKIKPTETEAQINKIIAVFLIK
ncbi:MAG: hypothetical protein JNN00_08035 [Chitinophagaceae bacterium]|nr:hypothetical protein [Chitinophagaceae bacterium]